MRRFLQLGGRLHATVTMMPKRTQSAFGGLATRRAIASLVVRPPAGGRHDSSGGGSSHGRFHFWSHATVAATSGVTLVASAEELKKEQAAGDQMIDMMMPLLQQLSMGSALVRFLPHARACPRPFKTSHYRLATLGTALSRAPAHRT
jgi:hypothetical protein